MTESQNDVKFKFTRIVTGYIPADEGFMEFKFCKDFYGEDNEIKGESTLDTLLRIVLKLPIANDEMVKSAFEEENDSNVFNLLELFNEYNTGYSNDEAGSEESPIANDGTEYSLIFKLYS